MSRAAGKSKLDQVAARLDGHSPHGDITGVKRFDSKPKMIGTGLNAQVSEQSKDETNNKEVVVQKQEELKPNADTLNQEIIVHERNPNRSIFTAKKEDEPDTKGMSFQIDLDLIPIIKKYVKWGKGYKTINLMLISTLLDNEEMVEGLVANDIVAYNTLIKLEEKYQKKLEEH